MLDTPYILTDVQCATRRLLTPTPLLFVHRQRRAGGVACEVHLAHLSLPGDLERAGVRARLHLLRSAEISLIYFQSQFTKG